MVRLFSEYKLKDITFKNRIVMAPMCMYSADSNGYPTDWHFTHYTTRAVGGVGLILIEATGVEPRGRISENDLGIWEDGQITPLKKIVKACHVYGAKVGIQIAHAGRKSETTGDNIIAPSSIKYGEEFRKPVEMTKEDIKAVVKAFGQGARRAREAGFDVVEIHGAHGYLINEFLSPVTNKREDEYGGSIENRVRFLREVLQEVKNYWPKEKPIIVRVTAEDYVEGGNHPEDLGEMLKLVADEGVDIVNVSTGGLVDVVPPVYPGYQVRTAETLHEISGLPTIAGGLLTEALMAEEILQNERADMVYLGRELLRNPYWPLEAAHKLKADVQWPIQYERGQWR